MRVQILTEAVYISHTLGKGMNPLILPRRVDWFFNLGIAIGLGEGKL